ncbi:MAG TPA: prenyltransferase [Candidatus Dormibacteraeota bacterium]|nr:prenyltransferase [Candidatus Dormibacteraeota bacterium]
MRELLAASRPFSWINTCLPFLATAIAAGHGASWPVALGALYFLFPFNLLMYGVNDLYDYESDRRNPRKGGMEGAVLAPAARLRTCLAVAVANVPLLVAIGWLAGPIAGAALGLTALMALAYSVPPLRTKEIPGVDSVTSSLHFTLPAACGGLVAGAAPGALPWRFLTAFFLWGIASQALGAIQDAEYDREAGVRSIATALGPRRTAGVCTAAYACAVAIVASAGGPALLAAAALVPYVLLGASCLGNDPGQARRAWKSFLGMNLLSGFVITQLLLHQWGLGGAGGLLTVAWGVAAVAWCCLAAFLLNELALRRTAAPTAPAPSLTVVVPARNEEGRVGAAVRALRGQAYPGPVELLVVDDDSCDGTRREAAEALGPAGRLIAAPPLPEGWTGKCWACSVAAEQARGRLIAFVDADTELAPGALAALAAQVEAQGGGLSSLLTRYRMDSPGERALAPAFALFQLCFLPVALLNLTRGSVPWAAFAYGPAVLVEASDYRRAGGHAAISGSVRDDFDLGRLLARAGAPVSFERGADLAATRHFRSAGDAASCWRRMYDATCGRSLPVALIGLVGPAMVTLAPPALAIAAVATGDTLALTGAVLAVTAVLLLRVLLAWRERQPWRTILWHPVTFAAACCFQAASVADGLAGRAPVWRGRRVPGEMAR